MVVLREVHQLFKLHCAHLALILLDAMLFKSMPHQPGLVYKRQVTPVALEIQLALVKFDVLHQTLLVAKCLLAQETSENGLVLVVTHSVLSQAVQRPEFLVAKLALMHRLGGVVRVHVRPQAEPVSGFPAAHAALQARFLMHAHVHRQMALHQETAAANLADKFWRHLFVLQQVPFEATRPSELFRTLGAPEGFFTSMVSLVLLQLDSFLEVFGALVALVPYQWFDHVVVHPQVILEASFAVELHDADVARKSRTVDGEVRLQHVGLQLNFGGEAAAAPLALKHAQRRVLRGHVKCHVREALQAQFAGVHVDDERRRDQVIQSESKHVETLLILHKSTKERNMSNLIT